MLIVFSSVSGQPPTIVVPPVTEQAPKYLRGLAWLSFSDVGVVLTASATSDGGGGVTQAWSTMSNVPCRIDPLRRMQHRGTDMTGGAIDERSTHIVTVPPGTTVAAGDRFSITGRGTFEITAVHVQTGALAHMFEVIAAF